MILCTHCWKNLKKGDRLYIYRDEEGLLQEIKLCPECEEKWHKTLQRYNYIRYEGVIE